MEVGAHVWLRSESSNWGWVPAKIVAKEDGHVGGLDVIHLTLTNDVLFEDKRHTPRSTRSPQSAWGENDSANFEGERFRVVITVDPEQLKTAEHDDIKLRNLPSSYHSEELIKISGGTPVHIDESDTIVGGVDDLIGLVHLHEPAILHALQLRYENDIIYTSTGPILIAVNPFKQMGLYSEAVMENYRKQGELGLSGSGGDEDNHTVTNTPFKRRTNDSLLKKMKPSENKARLPPHVYQTADTAYRIMMRGVENRTLMNSTKNSRNSTSRTKTETVSTDQSILVSGESGAGKTVTTKIVLNYFAMLSKKASESGTATSGFLSPAKKPKAQSADVNDFSIERQVLQSNPILESFGNARTIRNDNSSRFGKYIDIRFNSRGQLTGASVETYLLEKVRLIKPSEGERNYHIFYQFLSSATHNDRDQFYLDEFTPEDFKLLSQSGTYHRRDGVKDSANHTEMLDAMNTMGFQPDLTMSIMRLVVAVLFAGNMTFVPDRNKTDESCILEETHASLATAALLGVSFEDLASSITSRTINTGREIIETRMTVQQAVKASEAIIKAIYGAMFDFIVEKINESISESHRDSRQDSAASIGVLDIFGFETFKHNNFEQLCINYTNEALQQQFNRYVFKLEQMEYEKEGILWKYISFPDNQDVLDLIDKKHVGILSLLDEQCIVPQSTDERFCRYLYAKCNGHNRFLASSAQRVDFKFSVVHYAGNVEYSTDTWLEKNKDQLPAKCSALIKASSFKLLTNIQRFIRSETREGRGTVVQKSVGAQFAQQLESLRKRIDVTTPHYIRCLKPNDDLVPDYFEPRNIVEQLRCGGVIEAVRVSRAGYPTRYPHDVFLARYYILGDKSRKSSNREEALRYLVEKIAFDVWHADHLMLLRMIEAERLQEELSSPRYSKAEVSSVPVYYKGNQIVNGPMSLAVRTSAHTPQQSKVQAKKSTAARLSLQSFRERAEHSQINRPESEEEFWNLDFSRRCAVSGIQLGRTKVFLRREAFDRIESMRSQMFFGSAAKIQAMVRGKLYREQYQRMRNAAIKIQSATRMMLSVDLAHTKRVRKALEKRAVVIMQRWFRCNRSARNTADKLYCAARVIQARMKGIIARNKYYSCLFGIIQLQALYRASRVRRKVVDARSKASREKYLSTGLSRVAAKHSSKEITPRKFKSPTASVVKVSSQLVCKTNELLRYIQLENWSMVEQILDKRPELAEEIDTTTGELPLHVVARHKNAWTLLVDMILVLFPKALVHRDNMGALPIHHASAHDNLSALEIIYSAYKDGIGEFDSKGRLPLHVAAEFDAIDSVKFLLSKNSEASFTMVYRPQDGDGGGLPLHVACRHYASIGVITALLAENFSSAKRADENGDLPLHLLLRCGEVVDQVVVKTLLTCFSGAASRTDMYGDLPLSIALKYRCKSAVVNSVLVQYPSATTVHNSEGHSALHLAFDHRADDRTILAILNHSPDLATVIDQPSGLLPIQVATAREHSHFIVHNLLKRDMPIDLNQKIRAQLLPHHFSWNHIVTNTDDIYHEVVAKILQQCTQPQVLALAHVEGPDGRIALASATPVCKYEMRVMLRLFNTLEVVNQKPAFTNPVSDTQIFYALRYEPPPSVQPAFTVLHEEKHDRASADYVEEYDDNSAISGLSKQSLRSQLSNRSQQGIAEKLRYIRKEKGQQVIAKLTSRSDIVERELRIRKDFHLSRHYVPAIISVHHTVQHAAYSEAMAEPGYCITMEGADTTAENLMLDLRKAGKPFPLKALKRIGIALLHLHEHGLIHGDFGSHNIGKFGNRWKLLSVGGSVSIGKSTDPNRGFYHPPESILVESKRSSLGKKDFASCVVSLSARPSYDIWAYGVLLYEAISGVPLSAYACKGKRAMSSSDFAKIGQWDEHSLKKALRQVDDTFESAKDLLRLVLQPEPEKRIGSMRNVLEHSFFADASGEPSSIGADRAMFTHSYSMSSNSPSSQLLGSDSARTNASRLLIAGDSNRNSIENTRRNSNDNVQKTAAIQLNGKQSASVNINSIHKTAAEQLQGRRDAGINTQNSKDSSPDRDSMGSMSKKSLFGFRNKMRSSRAHV